MGRHRPSRLRQPGTISARAVARDRAESRNARLGAIYTALAAVHAVTTSSASVTDLYARACNALAAGGAYRSSWAGRLVDDGALRVVAMAGKALRAPPDRIEPERPSQAWVRALRARVPTLVRESDHDARDAVVEHIGARRALYVPVEGESGALGVLCAECPDRDAFDRHEIAMLVELGRSLATHAERLVAERSLETQRELLRAVFDCATYGIYYASEGGHVLLCNDALLRLVGRRREEMIGQSYQVITSPEFRGVEDEVVARVMSTGLPSEYDKDAVRSDGFRIPVRLSVAPVRNRAGRVVGSVAVVRDTVAEREAAKALRESEHRYRAAFRNNPDAIFVVGPSGHIVDANPAATALTGLARDALLREDVASLASDDARGELTEALAALRRDSAVYRPEVRFRTSGERGVTTELHGTTLAPQLWQLLARDIEARLEAEAKLRTLNDQLEEKVVARTCELEEANTKLARAGRLKDEFLANMSHELRTPLNSVLGLADALLEGVFGELDEQQQQILETMRSSGHHLLELINDILDLSKIEAGRLELDLRSVSVIEVCQTSLRMVRQMAIKKRVGSWMRTDPGFSVVVTDERRLKQMLVNLLSNAVKFTQSSGQVGLEAWADGPNVFFSVSDTGIGIAPPDLRRIFEPFTQIDSSLARQQEGTGLGLALVRKLAELQGGHIDVDSEPERGSRFTIVLPRIEMPDRESLLPIEED